VLVVLWSHDTSTISGWSHAAQSIPNSLKQLSGEIPSVSVWFGHRSSRRRATETVDRASSPSTPRSTRHRRTGGRRRCTSIAVFVVVGDDRCDVESLSDTAVPANSSRRTLLPSCRPDLHTGQQLKCIPWMSISNSQPYYKFQFYRLRDQWNAPSLLSIIPRTFTIIYLRPWTSDLIPSSDLHIAQFSILICPYFNRIVFPCCIHPFVRHLSEPYPSYSVSFYQN